MCVQFVSFTSSRPFGLIAFYPIFREKPNWINICFVIRSGPAMASTYDQMSLNTTPTKVLEMG